MTNLRVEATTDYYTFNIEILDCRLDFFLVPDQEFKDVVIQQGYDEVFNFVPFVQEPACGF